MNATACFPLLHPFLPDFATCRGTLNKEQTQMEGNWNIC